MMRPSCHHGKIMPDWIPGSLNGRRIGVTGFSEVDTARIMKALEAAGAVATNPFEMLVVGNVPNGLMQS